MSDPNDPMYRPTNHYDDWSEEDLAATRLERPVQGFDPDRRSVDETRAWTTPGSRQAFENGYDGEKPSKWLLVGVAALSIVLGLLLGYLLFHTGGPLDGSNTKNTVGINPPPSTSASSSSSVVEPTTTTSTSSTTQPKRSSSTTTTAVKTSTTTTPTTTTTTAPKTTVVTTLPPQ